MLFDDRLATVLRMRATGDAALRTQFRQLLDLLGSADGSPSPVIEAAFARLAELGKTIAPEDQSRILREANLRLRNRQLVEFLAAGEAKTAASAMATARLSASEWLALIPRLPVTARGFLRHRRDLPPAARDLLERLGVGDLVLPQPQAVTADDGDALLLIEEATDDTPSPALAPAPAPVNAPDEDVAGAIGELRRRIEAFQRARTPSSPKLPMAEMEEPTPAPAHQFEFVSDPDGIVVWATPRLASQVVGLPLTDPDDGAQLALAAPATRTRLRARLPLEAAPITLDAAPDISGEWRLDAAPRFAAQGGAFLGYRGRLTRPTIAEFEGEAPDSPAELMRQVLHELRTPVNAIQGFAEIIQQQLFAPVPHEYRAHAAAIAVDAAKLLAGFDEIDRLVKLESGVLPLDEGEADLRAVVFETIRRLDGVLRPRNAGFAFETKGGPFTVAISQGEALGLVWRLLATAAGALGPGEEIRARLKGTEDRIELRLDVPRAMRMDQDAAPAEARSQIARRSVVSAGMFGPEFAFRLAAAEAQAARGELICKGRRVLLVLPTLTAPAADHSKSAGRAGG